MQKKNFPSILNIISEKSKSAIWNVKVEVMSCLKSVLSKLSIHSSHTETIKEILHSENIQTILNSLIFDGIENKFAVVRQASLESLYQLMTSFSPLNLLSENDSLLIQQKLETLQNDTELVNILSLFKTIKHSSKKIKNDDNK